MEIVLLREAKVKAIWIVAFNTLLFVTVDAEVTIIIILTIFK